MSFSVETERTFFNGGATFPHFSYAHNVSANFQTPQLRILEKRKSQWKLHSGIEPETKIDELAATVHLHY